MDCDNDILAGLGFLALGTRLKRLAEQLQAGVSELLADEKIAVHPGQLPLLVAISRTGGATVAELVRAIGVSQPAISRALRALEREGLVEVGHVAGDARVRRAQLTARSRKLLDRLEIELFTRVAGAASELCDGLDFLNCLALIEKRNRELPFAQRIRKQPCTF